MNLYFETTAALQRYMVTSDKSMLDQAIALIRSEIDEPTLQPCTLSLDKMTTSEADARLAEEHYLKLSTEDVTDSAPIQTGKWIRVVAMDQPENTCMLLKVAHFDAKYVLLVPPNRGAEAPL